MQQMQVWWRKVRLTSAALAQHEAALQARPMRTLRSRS